VRATRNATISPQSPALPTLLFLLSLLPTLTRADISLPLGPYYRPGKYIPVQVIDTAKLPTERARTFILASDTHRGVIPTRIRSSTGVRATVPLLILDSRAKRITFANDSSHELQPLPDTDRLIGWTTPDEPFVRQLIPSDARIIPILLDPAQPIKGQPAAWEALDLILLDATSGQRLTEPQLAALVAAGVTVAIRTDTPPHPAWPWKRSGAYAVLSRPPAGPAITPFRDDVYLPVADWQPGLPARARHQILLAAALACILLLALAIGRPRRAALYALLTCIAIAALLHVWGKRQLAPRQAAGEILVVDPPLTQTDTWTYQTTPADRTVTLPWDDTTRPVFASRAGLDEIPVFLECDPTGRPLAFDIHLPAYRKLAFLTRTLTPRTPQTPPTLPIASPLKRLAENLYLTPGARLAGQLPSAPDNQWNPIVITR
jgi:hypothetical protein